MTYMIHGTDVVPIAVGILAVGAMIGVSWFFAVVTTNRDQARRKRAEAAHDRVFRRILAVMREYREQGKRINSVLSRALDDANDAQRGMAYHWVTNEAAVVRIETQAKELLDAIDVAMQHKTTAEELDQETQRVSAELTDNASRYEQKLADIEQVYKRKLEEAARDHQHREDHLNAQLAQIAAEKAALA